MPGFDIQHLMRQARKLEKAMEEARSKLGDITVAAEAAGGLVRVRMDGRCAVQRIEIDPKALPGAGGDADRTMLEDLVAAAVNAAVEKARAAADAAMAKASGGVKIPGMPG
jgi:DNA-binding YbaB/EbfC family protein